MASGEEIVVALNNFAAEVKIRWNIAPISEEEEVINDCPIIEFGSNWQRTMFL